MQDKQVRKVAFFDRDGVINENGPGYIYKITDFTFIDGCISLMQGLQQMGYALIIVTNQSGIGRGYYTEQDYQQLTQWYRNELANSGVKLLDIFHCPHRPETQCNCRKPKTGLFEQATAKYSIDLNRSLMIGDKLSDMQAAQAMNIRHRFLFSNSLLSSDIPDTLNNIILVQDLTKIIRELPL